MNLTIPNLTAEQLASIQQQVGGVTPIPPIPPTDPIPSTIEGLKVVKFKNTLAQEKFGPQAAIAQVWAVYNVTGAANTSSIFEDGGGQKQPRALYNLKAGQVLPSPVPWVKGPSQIHGWTVGDIVLFKADPDFKNKQDSFSSIKCQHES